MSQVFVSVQMVNFSDEDYVRRALPDGYTVAGSSKDGFLIDDLDGRHVSVAKVDNGYVSFLFIGSTTAGIEFENSLYKKYPALDPNKIVWAVFYRWYSAWALHRVSEDKVSAMEGMTSFEVDRVAVLCSVRAGNLRTGTAFETLTSQDIAEDGTVSSDDSGPMVITLTNLEMK